jgi:hypothetical protein
MLLAACERTAEVEPKNELMKYKWVNIYLWDCDGYDAQETKTFLFTSETEGQYISAFKYGWGEHYSDSEDITYTFDGKRGTVTIPIRQSTVGPILYYETTEI